MEIFIRHLSVLLRITILFTPLILISTQSKATSIDSGFDIFYTPTYSTTINNIQINTLTGVVNVGSMGVTLESLPLSFWNPSASSLASADTIVARKQDVDFNSTPNATIDIELVALSLKSVNAIDLTLFGGVGFADMYALVGGQFEDLAAGGGNGDGVCDQGETCIDLNLPTSGNQSPSVGQMTNLTHEYTDGGTFDSFYPNIFVDLIFTEVGNESNILFTGSAFDSLSSSGTRWFHLANDNHSFFVPEIDHAGPHPKVIAVRLVPEPTSLLLLSLGLIPLVYRRKNKA